MSQLCSDSSDLNKPLSEGKTCFFWSSSLSEETRPVGTELPGSWVEPQLPMNQDMGLNISECPCGQLWATPVRPHAVSGPWQNPCCMTCLSQVTQRLGHCPLWVAISNGPALSCDPQGDTFSFLPTGFIIKEGLGPLVCSFSTAWVLFGGLCPYTHKHLPLRKQHLWVQNAWL